LGQTAPGQITPGQTTAETKAEAHLDRELGQPASNGTAEHAALIMQRSGVSLLKAQLSAQPDPAQAKLAQISFFAVPEQQPKKLKKHDLVTIIVREESDIQSKGQNNFQKDAHFLAQVNQMIKLNLAKASIYGLPQPQSPAAVELTGNRTFNGTGEVDRTDSFTARVTAEVLDVKPNGTLVLQARKHIKTDEEEQLIVLTGTCRVEDVTADNSVLSTQLNDLDLQKNHKGDVRDATRRGVLGKLLDFINPF
jgi:flagellar L-ring protein precursor FlgH